MADEQHPMSQGLDQILQARDQAELLRDQLLAAFEKLQQECDENPDLPQNPNRLLGLQRMRKAIDAADLAIESINQGLRQIARVADDPSNPPDTPSH